MATAAGLVVPICPAYGNSAAMVPGPEHGALSLYTSPCPSPLTYAPKLCGPSIRRGIGDRTEASTSFRAVRRARGKRHTV
eukprot:5928693-Pyramimonas_sp.AAC.1